MIVPGRASYYAWRKLRQAVLDTYGSECRIRGPNCTGIADTVDHVVPRAAGGTDAVENLRPSCRACNFGRSKRIMITGPKGQLFPPETR